MTEQKTPALVRTLVPMIVGALATALLSALGIALPLEPATEVVTVVLSGAYYAVARWAEQRWPGIGKYLLGSSKQPSYPTPDEQMGG